MKLDQLHPRLGTGAIPGTQQLIFLCPKCQRQEICVDIWSGRAGDVQATVNGETITRRLWHAEQGEHRDWDSLSLTPSIDRTGLGDKCGGWHGFITNGEIVGGI